MAVGRAHWGHMKACQPECTYSPLGGEVCWVTYVWRRLCRLSKIKIMLAATGVFVY